MRRYDQWREEYVIAPGSGFLGTALGDMLWPGALFNAGPDPEPDKAVGYWGWARRAQAGMGLAFSATGFPKYLPALPATRRMGLPNQTDATGLDDAGLGETGLWWRADGGGSTASDLQSFEFRAVFVEAFTKMEIHCVNPLGSWDLTGRKLAWIVEWLVDTPEGPVGGSSPGETALGPLTEGAVTVWPDQFTFPGGTFSAQVTFVEL